MTFQPTSHLLFDVEGTTTDIAFVKTVLFPFAYDRLLAWLDVHIDEPDILNLAGIIAQTEDPYGGINSSSRTAYILRKWMDEDRKHPALKTIQGLIWQEGYENGELKGHVYEDVPRAFQRWQSESRQLGIYSSGSVLAQKLLFGHSLSGDLTPYLTAHFDTAVGPKQERASYTKIAEQWQIAPAAVTFFSDVEAECAAAVDAGMQAVRVFRGDAEPTAFPNIKSFDELFV